MYLPQSHHRGWRNRHHHANNPERDAIIQAAKVIADAARTSNRHSSIVVIGPFEPQIYDLSSSESGSSTRQPSLSGAISPITPTRPGKVTTTNNALVDQSPANQPDWVAYGAPIRGLEDVDMGSESGTECSSVAEERRHSDPQDDEWALLRLQALRLERSKSASARLHTRPFLAHPQQRVIPLQLPHIRPRPSPIVIPRPEMVINPIPIPSFAPMTPPSSASRDTLVPSDTELDSDPSRDPSHAAIKVRAQEKLLDDVVSCSACDACSSRLVHLLPCGDLACPSCFSSSIAAVSVSRDVSKCPACLEDVTSFKPFEGTRHISVKPAKRRKIEEEDVPQTVVMRIDNVAWDIEPHLVQDFLPSDSLPPDHPQPIHICLDRRDGRTKDYMYVEVKSNLAARRVLQECQNAYMTGGRVTRGRKRAVTVSIVSHEELLRELRPGSKAELLSLLELCVATLSAPPPQLRADHTGRGRLHASVGTNGKVHYIKYRHAPFHALMSIMSKLRGSDSPAYWDLFHVASGAVVSLSTSIKSQEDPLVRTADTGLMTRMVSLFDRCFGPAARPIQL